MLIIILIKQRRAVRVFYYYVLGEAINRSLHFGTSIKYFTLFLSTSDGSSKELRYLLFYAVVV